MRGGEDEAFLWWGERHCALLTVPGSCFFWNTELRLSGGVDPTGCVQRLLFYVHHLFSFYVNAAVTTIHFYPEITCTKVRLLFDDDD